MEDETLALFTLYFLLLLFLF